MAFRAFEQELVHDVVVGERFAFHHPKFIALVLSGVVAYLLAVNPSFTTFLHGLGALGLLGVFIVGLFYSYGFTTLPAISAFVILAPSFAPLELAFIGAIGATIGDYVLFHTARSAVKPHFGFIERLFRLHVHLNRGGMRVLRALSPLIAGLMLSSPIPDEVVAVLFSSVEMRERTLVICSFLFKFFGILVLAQAVTLL